MINQREADSSPTRLYYGYLIVVAAFFAFGIVYGTVIYSFSVFVNPISKTFEVSPTKVLFGFSLTNIGTGLLGIYAGRFLTRLRIRKGLFAGLAIMAIGFLALSAIRSLWQFYAIYGIIIAFGSIVVAPLGASALVANWFIAKRGRALTIATLGTSFGQLLLPRFAAAIIDGWGWPTAYRVFALMMIGVMPVIVLIAIDRPEDKGLLPHGGVVDQAGGEEPEPVLLTNRQILQRLDFWRVGFSYLLTVTVYLALVAVMVPYARTYGASALEASEMAVTMGAASIIGKIAFATWTDRIGLRNTFWVAIGLNLSACLLLVAKSDYVILFAASALVGGSAGGVLPLWPGMIAHRFGRNALPQVMGLMSPMVLIIQGFGAPLATAMHFRAAYVLFVAMLLGSLVLSYKLNKSVAVE